MQINLRVPNHYRITEKTTVNIYNAKKGRGKTRSTKCITMWAILITRYKFIKSVKNNLKRKLKHKSGHRILKRKRGRVYYCWRPSRIPSRFLLNLPRHLNGLRSLSFLLVYDVSHGSKAVEGELSIDILDLQHQALKEIKNLVGQMYLS